MAVVIKTECIHGCGEISVDINGISLHVNTGKNSPSYYSLTCPECGKTSGGQADNKFHDFLVVRGIEPDKEKFPIEVLEVHNGPLITFDDILDLHQLLEDPNCEQEWLSRLAESL